MEKTLTTSFRLTPQARKLLAELAEALGVSQTAVIELAIRAFVQQHEKETHERESGISELR